MNLNWLPFEAMLYGGVVGFFLLALILVCGFILVQIFTGKRFRYAALISHTVLVVAVGLLVKSSGDDAMSDLLWVIPLRLDVVLWPLKYIFGGYAYWGFGYISLVFLVLGGMQWYFAGYLVDYLWAKASARVSRQMLRQG